MFSRSLAVLAAVSLVMAAPAAAQESTAPASRDPTVNTERGGLFSSDLAFMLGAIAAAILITFLATLVKGDEADEPVSP